MSENQHGEKELITEMYVRESARRKGIATSLIAILEKKLQDLQVREVKILTGTNNLEALQTYTKSHYAKQEETVLFKELD